ncbi:MAG: Mth938-like domain-containing protein [Sedimenticola sp.]|nr:Mth938-like domain-containing protein [Sedimenticola sp.]
MKFSVADQSKGNMIHSYTEENVVVNGINFTTSLVIMEEKVISDWRPASFEKLTEGDFANLLEFKPDLVVLGTGPQQQFPAPSLYRALIDAGIGIEIMTTPAACRTYNILTSEGRRVVAALLFG